MSSRALVVIVTGSAATTPLPDYLVELGHALEYPLTVLLTETAQRFVPAEVAQWFADDVLTSDTPGLDPVELARTAHALVVLPASGHALACAALGLMGTPAAAALAESPGPSLYFPAMSGVVWDRHATRRHVANLREQGDTVVEPEPGPDGDGDGDGDGAILLPPAPTEVTATVLDFLNNRDRQLPAARDYPDLPPVAESRVVGSLHG